MLRPAVAHGRIRPAGRRFVDCFGSPPRKDSCLQRLRTLARLMGWWRIRTSQRNTPAFALRDNHTVTRL